LKATETGLLPEKHLGIFEFRDDIFASFLAAPNFGVGSEKEGCDAADSTIKSQPALTGFSRLELDFRKKSVILVYYRA